MVWWVTNGFVTGVKALSAWLENISIYTDMNGKLEELAQINSKYLASVHLMK